MSQSAVLVRVDGNLIPEVFSSVPDYDEAVRICKDNGYDGYYDCYSLEYEWIDIGEGESGVDKFIDDETLLALYDSYGYEDVIYDEFGLNVETIEIGCIVVISEDLEK